MKKLLILFLIFLTGCNYHELNDLAIVECASVDLINGEYVVNYGTRASKDDKEITLLEGKGKTISDAISDMNLKSPKELYIGHMLIYVISEDVAKNGVNKVIDYFFRDARHKKTFQFVIAKDNAKDILKTMSPLNNYPALNIAKNLTNENSLSEFVFNTTLMSFIKNVKDPGIEPIVNGIKVENKSLKLEPIAIFKDDKLIKWEDPIISESINILINQSSSFKIEAPCDNSKIIFSINDLNVKKTFKINDKIDFKIYITSNTKINEMSCDYDLNSPSDLEKIEDILVKTLKENLSKTIEELKKTKIDFLGLGYFIYQNDYYNYLRYKNDYIEKLNIDFIIKPNVLMNENSNEGTYDLNE